MGRLLAEGRCSRLVVCSATNSHAKWKSGVIRGDEALLLVSLWKSAARYLCGEVELLVWQVMLY